MKFLELKPSLQYPALHYPNVSSRRIYDLSVETLSTATDHFSDRVPSDLGRRGAAWRSQSTACSRAGFSSSHYGRVNGGRPFALGDRRESPSSAAGIYLRFAARNCVRAFGRMVPRPRRCRRSTRRRALSYPEVGALPPVYPLVWSRRNVEGDDDHDWCSVSGPYQHGHRREGD